MARLSPEIPQGGHFLGKDRERGDILALLRTETITLEEADSQLREIDAQKAAVQAEVHHLADRQALYDATEQQIRTAAALLADLRARLDEQSRQTVVRALVRKIAIRTEGEGRDRTVKAVVDYAFGQPNGFTIDDSQTGAAPGSPAREGA